MFIVKETKTIGLRPVSCAVVPTWGMEVYYERSFSSSQAMNSDCEFGGQFRKGGYLISKK